MILLSVKCLSIKYPNTSECGKKRIQQFLSLSFFKGRFFSFISFNSSSESEVSGQNSGNIFGMIID